MTWAKYYQLLTIQVQWWLEWRIISYYQYDKDNLSEELSVIDSKTTIMTYIIIFSINNCWLIWSIIYVVILLINAWWPMWLLVYLAYNLWGHCPMWPITYVIASLCSLWSIGSLAYAAYNLYNCWPMWLMTYGFVSLCGLWPMGSLACVTYDI